MIEEIASVIAVEGDVAIIRVEKTSSCGSCQASGSCGTSSLAAFFNFQPPQLKIRNTLDAKPGDQVVVGIEENSLVAGSFLIYIVPLLLLILFAVVAMALGSGLDAGDQELLQTFAGLLGLMVGLVIVKQQSPRLFRDMNSTILVRIIQQKTRQIPVKELRL
jgi:sigma-E factor negative regulatory protein RseC